MHALIHLHWTPLYSNHSSHKARLCDSHQAFIWILYFYGAIVCNFTVSLILEYSSTDTDYVHLMRSFAILQLVSLWNIYKLISIVLCSTQNAWVSSLSNWKYPQTKEYIDLACYSHSRISSNKYNLNFSRKREYRRGVRDWKLSKSV